MHYLVANDSKSQISCTLVRNDTGNAVNLTDLSTKLKIRAKNSLNTISTVTGSIISAMDGEVLFELDTFLTNRSAGYYEGEVFTEDVDGKEIVYELIDFSSTC